MLHNVVRSPQIIDNDTSKSTLVSLPDNYSTKCRKLAQSGRERQTHYITKLQNVMSYMTGPHE